MVVWVTAHKDALSATIAENQYLSFMIGCIDYEFNDEENHAAQKRKLLFLTSNFPKE
jgi:hypothetical protein